MNNLCTLLNNLAKNNTIKAQDLDDLEALIGTVVKSSLGCDENIVITSWVDNNSPYIDFSYALRPDWLEGTTDDKQVKMRLSIDTSDQTWYAHMVMDCENGEIESWGEKEFSRGDLEEYGHPIQYMLIEIKKQYEKKLREEQGKQDSEITKAQETLKLLEPHVEAIKKICKEKGITLYADHSLDGTNCMYVVPKGIQCLADENENTIDLDTIPYIDFDARGFDPNYDFFHKVK